MSNIRAIQQSIDVIGLPPVANMQVVQQSIDVIGLLPEANMRVVQQSIDVIGTVAVPGLQVSQQNVLVAGTKESQARVSRAYLEVLSIFHTYSIEHQIPLAQTLQIESYQKDLSSTLVFSQTVGASIQAPNASNTLAPTQAADYRLIPLSHGTSALTFTQALSYIGPHWIDADTTLSLTGTARIAETYEPTASSTLTFTETTVPSGSLHYWFSSSLDLGSYADTTEKVRGVLEYLDLTQVATSSVTKFASSALTLTQEVTQGIIWKSVTDTLALTQTATGHQSIITVGPGLYDKVPLSATELALDDTVGLYPIFGRASNTLALSQDVDIRYAHHVSATSELITELVEIIDDEFVTTYTGLSQTAGRNAGETSRSAQEYLQWYSVVSHVLIRGAAQDLSANSTLSLTQTGIKSIAESTSSTLTLSQTASGVVGITADNTIEATGTASYNAVLSRSITDTLDLESSFGYTTSSVNLCTYDSTMGSTTSANDPRLQPLINEPTFVRQDHITLTYPWSSPVNTVELRNPSLNNKNTLEFQRINRKTRGGSLVVWAHPDWPKNETVSIDIQALSETKGQELIAFIVSSIGKEIGFTDWEGNLHRGVILNPETLLHRNRTCDLSVSLEIEITWSDPIGLAISNGAGDTSMTLSGVATVQKITSAITSSNLTFYQPTNPSPGIKVRSATSTISLTDIIGMGYDVNATSTISLSDRALFTQIGDSTLSLTQEAWNSMPSVNAASTLSITDTSRSSLINLSAESELQVWYQREVVKE